METMCKIDTGIYFSKPYQLSVGKQVTSTEAIKADAVIYLVPSNYHFLLISTWPRFNVQKGCLQGENETFLFGGGRGC